MSDPLDHGCGDHGCLIKKPEGMGTNGGCRCRPYKLGILIKRQRAEIERLRAALERLGSSEAMTLAFAINKNTNEGRELDARITFAREVLQEGE